VTRSQLAADSSSGAKSAQRRVALGIGSNLGSRVSLARAAVSLIAGEAGVARLRVSNAWFTRPVGPPQPAYVNAAVAFDTGMTPQEILALARRVESTLGRVRGERWIARTMDIDVLWIDGERVDEPGLRVPHAALTERVFALAPLLQLVPDARDPTSGACFSQSLDGLDRRDLLGEWAFDEESHHLAFDAAEQLAFDALRGVGILARGGSIAPVAPSTFARDVAAGTPTEWTVAVRLASASAGMVVRHVVVFRLDDAGVQGAIVGTPSGTFSRKP